MKCAELACKDARDTDINMGCPLKFSTSNGAGTALLLKKAEIIRNILTTLRRNLPSDVGVT
jgi:tRNA-dihydrouridine synthase 2